MTRSVRKKMNNQLRRKKRQATKQVLRKVIQKKASAIDYSNMREDKNFCRLYLW